VHSYVVGVRAVYLFEQLLTVEFDSNGGLQQ
jgi:hypothetical protein